MTLYEKLTKQRIVWFNDKRDVATVVSARVGPLIQEH